VIEMKRFTAVLRAATLCVAALASSCATGGHDPKWIEASVETPNETVLMQVTMMSLQKVGFPIGSGFEMGKLTGISGWNISPGPFKGEGFRERCYIEYKPLGGKRYAMKVRVERETNEDIVHPLDISYAEWEPDADNEARARLLVGQVKAFLGPDFKTTSKETLEKQADEKKK
jgi:hypothetical protein